MNKEELINAVATKMNRKKVEVRQTIDEVFDCITGVLASGKKFQYIGFGSFSVKKRAGRNGVNPRTRERITIKPRQVAYFTPGKRLSDKVSVVNKQKAAKH